LAFRLSWDGLQTVVKRVKNEFYKLFEHNEGLCKYLNLHVSTRARQQLGSFKQWKIGTRGPSTGDRYCTRILRTSLSTYPKTNKTRLQNVFFSLFLLISSLEGGENIFMKFLAVFSPLKSAAVANDTKCEGEGEGKKEMMHVISQPSSYLNQLAPPSNRRIHIPNVKPANFFHYLEFHRISTRIFICLPCHGACARTKRVGSKKGYTMLCAHMN
jgi:hypothetical protein